MLHVHCGACSADIHRQTELPGEVITWFDPLCEGPTPSYLSPSEWSKLRAEYLVALTQGAFTVAENLQWQRRQNEAFAGFRQHDELVLWFDGCIFDQTILLRHLSTLRRLGTEETIISLISVAEYPGRPDFKGLGELAPDQLARLFPTRVKLTADDLAAGHAAWCAYGSDDPLDIERWLSSAPPRNLPHLAAALRRHLEEFPSTDHGLSRLQEQILRALSDGPLPLGQLFAAVSAMEERPWFGDTTLWHHLNALAEAAHPLLRLDDPAPIPTWQPPPETTARTVAITETGRKILAGHADLITLNGIDRWRGGTHLHGPAPHWRYNPESRTLARHTPTK